jgi:hypothetical protein
MKKCISCGYSLNPQLCSIGKQYPSAIYNNNGANNSNLNSTSLDLAMCNNIECRLVQLHNVVNLDYVYSHYPYQTSTTATMKELLKDFSRQSLSKSSIESGDVVLDIGGNDGTLLSNFVGLGVQLVNIDIASGIQQILKDDSYVYINAKFTKLEYEKTQLKAPKLIFSSAVFYQIPDPDNFCSDLWEIMDDESVFFLQMTYLGTMYKNKVYDNVVHEHLGYYSLFSLSSLLKRNKLKIIDVSLNEMYGGSMRVMIVKDSSERKINSENIHKVEIFELANKTNEIETMLNFAIDFNNWKDKSLILIADLIERYDFLVGLGASTKGNMLLQALKVDQTMMKYIVDNNEKKIGAWTSGSLIPIVDESYLLNPHKAMFLLPYYYLDFFIELLEKSIRKEEFIELFVPLPYPKVVKVWGTQ